jgi:mannose-1-phosphate guanylyltransferase
MPIGGRPLLEYWLQTLKQVDIREVLVNTHFHADKVHQFLAREHFSGWVKAVHEEELKGTAGTVQANINFFRGHTMLLIHADNWCQCDFSAFVRYHLHQRPSHCPLTMMTFNTDVPQSCGIVETDNQGVVKAFYEKVANPPSRCANAAVYILEPEVLDWMERHTELNDFSTEVLPHYVGRIATWHNAGVHRDIGTIVALRAAQFDPMPEPYWPRHDEWLTKFESSKFCRAIFE